jgi:ectoine hydroxylase-related dioxygenase (phytanoyl-CoA dioxygenase family)
VTCLNQIVGKDIEFLSFKAVFKDSTTNFPSPWHQDWHYWKGTTKISIWIALDDADESNGCLKLVPESHKDVVHMNRVQDGMGFIHRISSDERMKDYPIAVAPLSTGDAIFFHDLTIHASCPNINGEDRWAAIATYRDASLKDESPIWSSSIVLSGESVNSPLSSNI